MVAFAGFAPHLITTDSQLDGGVGLSRIFASGESKALLGVGLLFSSCSDCEKKKSHFCKIVQRHNFTADLCLFVNSRLHNLLGSHCNF